MATELFNEFTVTHTENNDGIWLVHKGCGLSIHVGWLPTLPELMEAATEHAAQHVSAELP